MSDERQFARFLSQHVTEASVSEGVSVICWDKKRANRRLSDISLTLSLRNCFIKIASKIAHLIPSRQASFKNFYSIVTGFSKQKFSSDLIGKMLRLDKAKFTIKVTDGNDQGGLIRRKGASPIKSRVAQILLILRYSERAPKTGDTKQLI